MSSKLAEAVIKATGALNELCQQAAKSSIGTGICCKCAFYGAMFKKVTDGRLCFECFVKSVTDKPQE